MYIPKCNSCSPSKVPCVSIYIHSPTFAQFPHSPDVNFMFKRWTSRNYPLKLLISSIRIRKAVIHYG